MITPLMLTGRSTDHLVTLSERHHLQFNATKAFLALQQQAAKAGFKLMPASSFRSFERQLAIWNGKFEGTRPVLDAESQPIDIQTLSEGQRCEAILKWSALPGASRHHWGTEIDFYDPFRLPNGQSLQLEPWEYEQGGYFAQLNGWLTENMSAYDFYRPFTDKESYIAYEPWHISYLPLSYEASQAYTIDILRAVLEEEPILGKQWLLDNLETVYQRYIVLPE
ncbi:peptidase M15 [Proteus mirabilis]|uniref:M15 family metallopeptidase n=1 Tax=Proteus mirabilis TaxID=584 RepID=UPI000B9FCC11|nr:M15 family metallopeptidase [Proteus mirabilis]EGT3586400.1 M15 family metallopeptidase [Proteus mirabilis]MBG5978382.1 M15 family metallopeptidase [Proteus mirabilis]OZS67041.1 peptidase M15 [Proteus mirabilis]